MSRKTRTQIRTGTEILAGQSWQWRIRNPKFWEDLNDLNKKLLLFLKPALADRKKFGHIAAVRLFEYEKLTKWTEDKWGLSPIPMWAALFATSEKPNQSGVKLLEELYQSGTVERPIPYASVRVLQYHPVEDFLDLRLDLKSPLYVLMGGVEAEAKKLSSNPGRQRSKEAEFQLRVFDLKEYDHKSFRSIAVQLKKPDSTVRSAYDAARKRIGIVTPTKKKESQLDHPGPIFSCPDQRCRVGEKLCDAHEAWASQDSRYLREYLKDPSRIEGLKTSAEIED